MMTWVVWMLGVLGWSRQLTPMGERPRPAAGVRRAVRAIRAIVLGAALTASAADAADSFRDLQIAYRCEVVRRLEQIAATGDPKVERDRFLAVSVARRLELYVQCMFHNANTMAYCEAASGFYLTKPDAPRKFRATERTVAALAQLGFDTDDSAGNF